MNERAFLSKSTQYNNVNLHRSRTSRDKRSPSSEGIVPVSWFLIPNPPPLSLVFVANKLVNIEVLQHFHTLKYDYLTHQL